MRKNMGLKECGIRPEELTGVGVLGLADTPDLNALEMQEKFEETARGVIIPKLNALIDALQAASGSAELGAVDPVTGENVTVQLALESLLQGVVRTAVQELTEEQREAARHNIHALAWDAQELDTAQKTQARANIGAIGSAEVNIMAGSVSYKDVQDLTAGEKMQARANIGAVSEEELATVEEQLQNAAQNAQDAAENAQEAAGLALAGVGAEWIDISSQYSVTCSNANITGITLTVHKKGNTYHFKLSFSNKTKIALGTKITFTVTGGQLPLWSYHDACYSDETIGIGIFSPEGTITMRVLAADWPSGYNLNYTYEYTV